MTRAHLVESTEWDGRHTRLVRLAGLPRGPREYKKRAVGGIEHVYVHQSAGNRLNGVEAPYRIAKFHAGPPKRSDSGRWVGGGRGWPGIGYTFVVPSVPDTQDGKFVVYRCHEDDVWSYHTGRGANKHGVAVCVAGSYQSRHSDNPRAVWAPDSAAITALNELVLDYLVPRYGLKPTDVLGHFDAGKPACPGDFLEQWVRHVRGECAAPNPRGPSPLDEGGEAPLVLDTWKQRQQALFDLGFDAGPVDGIPGEMTKGAILAFQSWAGITVDGRWGPNTARALRRLTNEHGVG